MGKLITYGDIANKLGNPRASRAVGTAIGSNPIAFLITCHRVIQSTGAIGGYMWGSTRTAAIIGWEGAKNAIKTVYSHIFNFGSLLKHFILTNIYYNKSYISVKGICFCF